MSISLRPSARIVMGSLYDPSTTDAEGKPLVVKTGPNAGQPLSTTSLPWQSRARNCIGRIPPLGSTNLGGRHQAFLKPPRPPTFAWKIVDGDSQTPNKKGRKPCENEGWRAIDLKFPAALPRRSTSKRARVTSKSCKRTLQAWLFR